MAIGLGTVVNTPTASNISGSFTAGNSLLIAVMWEGPGDGTNNMTINTLTCTNETPDVWDSKTVNTGPSRRPAIQFARVNSLSQSGTKTIAVTFTGGTPSNYSLHAVELSGTDTSTGFYGVNSAVGSVVLPSVDITTTAANAAIVVFLNVNATPQPSISGYTSLLANEAMYAGYLNGYRNLDVGSAATKTITTDIGDVWLIKGVAIGIAGGGGGGGVPKTNRLALLGVG